MGSDVYNDINAFDEREKDSVRKVILIYTTAGNLNDDDTKSCDCHDPADQEMKKVPYWLAREAGAKNSSVFAACKVGGTGVPYPLPVNRNICINGHCIARYAFKNTISYFLRINAKEFGEWFYFTGRTARTVDSSTTYKGWTDFVNTLTAIYGTELGIINDAVFGMPDYDEAINPKDHDEHLMAGRAAAEAAASLAENLDTCFPQRFYMGYNIKNLPQNLASPNIQNKSAMTAVYCLALLDYNAWPEWGATYSDWCSKSYSRTAKTCDASSASVANPQITYDAAEKMVEIRYGTRVLAPSSIRISNASAKVVHESFEYAGEANMLQIPVGHLRPGNYTLSITTKGAATLDLPITLTD
jgi:hypothetical protein